MHGFYNVDAVLCAEMRGSYDEKEHRFIRWIERRIEFHEEQKAATYCVFISSFLRVVFALPRVDGTGF